MAKCSAEASRDIFNESYVLKAYHKFSRTTSFTRKSFHNIFFLDVRASHDVALYLGDFIVQ